MTLKKLISQLHLWLGLSSGLVVFIVAITGCIYAFQHEIQELTQSYRFVEPQSAPVLPPSEIRKIADAQLPGKHIHGILYQGEDRAAQAIYWMYEEYYDFVYINQYTGEVLKVKDEFADFFRIVLDGHFYLWLPDEIGQPVVASFTLVFIVLLISGIVLWWPKNKKGRKKSFKIKWNARWRRKNYDLHSVMGIYVMIIALILAITGLTWGFEWFRDGLHVSLGGDGNLEYEEPLSDTTAAIAYTAGMHPVDYLWEKTKAENTHAETIEMHFPATDESPIHVAVNPDASTYWEMDYIYYNQYSLEEIQADHIYSRFHDANMADKLLRMNYDIHTGAIMGLPGKILAFFASLIVASLPVTGTLLWIGRRNKKKEKHEKEIKRINRESRKPVVRRLSKETKLEKVAS
ncbi:MAG: PepSY-associated TM helix domain-containing protein [Candidatus Cyclobacteriaceae bacterium M2_1C_046]